MLISLAAMPVQSDLKHRDSLCTTENASKVEKQSRWFDMVLSLDVITETRPYIPLRFNSSTHTAHYQKTTPTIVDPSIPPLSSRQRSNSMQHEPHHPRSTLAAHIRQIHIPPLVPPSQSPHNTMHSRAHLMCQISAMLRRDMFHQRV